MDTQFALFGWYINFFDKNNYQENNIIFFESQINETKKSNIVFLKLRNLDVDKIVENLLIHKNHPQSVVLTVTHIAFNK